MEWDSNLQANDVNGSLHVRPIQQAKVMLFTLDKQWNIFVSQLYLTQNAASPEINKFIQSYWWPVTEKWSSCNMATNSSNSIPRVLCLDIRWFVVDDKKPRVQVLCYLILANKVYSNLGGTDAFWSIKSHITQPHNLRQ